MSAVPAGFRPRGAGTGVGGLPHDDPAACVAAAVGACPGLPFWPTRPEAVPDEEMVRQWALGLPGVGEAGGGLAWVGRDEAPGGSGLVPSAAGTLDPFLHALRSLQPGWLKVQATGPVTLALALRTGGREVITVPAARAICRCAVVTRRLYSCETKRRTRPTAIQPNQLASKRRGGPT